MKSLSFTLRLWLFMGVFLLSGTIYAQFDEVYRIAGHNLENFTVVNKHLIKAGDAYFVSGTVSDDNNDQNIFITSTDTAGSVLWAREYGQTGDFAETAFAVEKNAFNDTMMVLGEVEHTGFGAAQTLVLKVDASTGNLVWSRRYRRSIQDDARIISRHIGPQGQAFYVIVGTTEINTLVGVRTKTYAMAINGTNGAVIWKRIYREGVIEEARFFNMEVTGYTKTYRELALVGRYYHSHCDSVENNRRNVFFFRINPLNGAVVTNSFRLYDMQRNPMDFAIETEYPYDWDVTTVRHPEGGFFAGYALTGAYVRSDDCENPQQTEVVVMRLDTAANPQWANIYPRIDSLNGFGRSIYQNQNNPNFLSILTNHQKPGSTTEITGLLHVRIQDGSLGNYLQNKTAFRAISMRRGALSTTSPGYVALSQKGDEDLFQLMAINEAGTSSNCMEPIEVLAKPLQKNMVIKELLCKRIPEVVRNYEIPDPALEVIQRPCEEVCVDCGNEEGEARKAQLLTGTVKVYPNPLTKASNAWQIDVDAKQNGPIEIVIWNQLNQLVYRSKMEIHAGKNQLSLPASQIPAGFLILQIRQGNQMIHQQKLIKQ